MPVRSPQYPPTLVIAGRRVLVVGGGRVAAAKVAELLACLARVEVVAPEAGDRIQDLAASGTIIWSARRYAATDLDGAWLVITATDDPAVNAQVAADAEASGRWCNSADDPVNCSFTLPSRVRQGPLLVTFSTGGHSPALSRWLRERYTEEFGSEYLTLIELLAEQRAEIIESGGSTEGLAWSRALSSGMLELIREGNLAEAKERLKACLSSSSV